MNYYKDAITKKYADFSGRARRSEYWLFFLFNLIVAFVLGIVEAILGAGNIISLLYSLAVLIPSIAIGARRLHDTNRSGWWLLIGFIPLLGAIVLIIFFVMDSTPGTNQYGPNPKGIGGDGSKAGTGERLQHLDELLRNGLITQAEYDQRRLSILADV